MRYYGFMNGLLYLIIQLMAQNVRKPWSIEVSPFVSSVERRHIFHMLILNYLKEGCPSAEAGLFKGPSDKDINYNLRKQSKKLAIHSYAAQVIPSEGYHCQTPVLAYCSFTAIKVK